MTQDTAYVTCEVSGKWVLGFRVLRFFPVFVGFLGVETKNLVTKSLLCWWAAKEPEGLFLFIIIVIIIDPLVPFNAWPMSGVYLLFIIFMVPHNFDKLSLVHIRSPDKAAMPRRFNCVRYKCKYNYMDDYVTQRFRFKIVSANLQRSLMQHPTMICFLLVIPKVGDKFRHVNPAEGRSNNFNLRLSHSGWRKARVPSMRTQHNDVRLSLQTLTLGYSFFLSGFFKNLFGWVRFMTSIWRTY